MTSLNMKYYKEFLNICAIVIKITLGIIALVFIILIFGRLLNFGIMLDAVMSSQKSALAGCLAYSFKMFFIVLIPLVLIIWCLIIRYIFKRAVECLKALKV